MRLHGKILTFNRNTPIKTPSGRWHRRLKGPAGGTTRVKRGNRAASENLRIFNRCLETALRRLSQSAPRNPARRLLPCCDAFGRSPTIVPVFRICRAVEKAFGAASVVDVGDSINKIMGDEGQRRTDRA